MANATITGTASNFGSISGVLAGEAGTVAGTITGVTGSLTGSVGVPGPQGPQGNPGPAGQGVPTGGTAGQVLAKIDGTDYNTEWINVGVSAKRDLTDYDFTNVTDEKIETFGLTIQPPVGTTTIYDSEVTPDWFQLYTDTSLGGTQEGQEFEFYSGTNFLRFRDRTWSNNDGTIEPQPGERVMLGVFGMYFTDWDGLSTSTMSYGRNSITFPNGSVQSIAFPGFNNAALTGNPTAPTAATGDNDTTIATTAFVQQELAAGTAIAKSLEVYVRNQTGATLTAGTIVYINGATGNRPTVTKAQANNDANSAQTFGFVKTSIANNGFGYVIVRGEVENLDTSALTEGQQLYLSPTTAGTWTTTKPYAPDHLVYVGIVVRAHPTQGVILVAIQNGYELDEIHDVKITSPSNGQVLKYDSAQGLWVNGTDSAPVTSVAGRTGAVTLSNTDISGLGTMATATATDYLAKAGNLSGLTDLATSRSNLGLGTMAVETASNYLTTSAASSTYAPLASPTFTGTVTIPAGASISGFAPLASPALTGTPTAPTAAAATNTTQIATTAFVQQEVPAASTTAAGKVELATETENILGTDTSRVLSVNDRKVSSLDCGLWAPGVSALSAATSGTGANASSTITALNGRLLSPNASTAGYATRGFVLYYPSNSANASYNFGTKSGHSIKVYAGSAWNGTYTDMVIRTVFGRMGGGLPAPATLAALGYGWEWNLATKTMNIIAHNGTGLTTKPVTWTPVNFRTYEITVTSDGAGTIRLYIDGAFIDSTTGGPTATNGASAIWWQTEIQNTSTSSTGATDFFFQNPKLYTTNG